ncbi:MAG TPA: thioesterase family protein [Streptosporangiaceae bacterium]
MDIPAPFRLHEVTVSPEWTDYNQHLTESAYLLIMGDSSDVFFRTFGVDDAYRSGGRSLYTVETHLRNLREAREGERLDLTIQVLGTDDKRLHIVHEMYSETGGLIATAEQMLLHVDMQAGRAVPFPGPIARRLREISAAHAAALPVPEYVGRTIAIPARHPRRA